DTVVKGAPPRPAGETAPGQRCILDIVGDPGSRSFFVKSPSGKYITYLGGGMTGRCVRQDITITADSVESYDESRIYYLIGNVKYREKRVNLDAQRVSYFRADERLLFEQDVKATLPNGTTMVGPTAEYFRAVRGVRAAARLVGRGRPTVTFIERDSLGKQAAPVGLVADELIADGDSLFYASRQVVLTRTDLVARSDSGFVHSGRQYARLMRNPIIESKGEEPYTLKGKAIDIHARNRQAERVVAQDSAVAESKDLILTADTIDLRVNEQKLQRAFAFGNRAHAKTPQRDVFAESLHVVMPNQRIREFRAIGFAYAETDPDTAKITSDERDWLRGDTIHAVFDSLAATDTASRPPIRKITASGNASSYQQVPSNDSTRRGPPAINYVTGRVIDVQFANDSLQTVRVIDQASGVYLEPAPPGDTARTNRTNPRATRRPPSPIRPPSSRGNR
ncbi:MAG TPA: hypothetical protein VJ717_12425, partial [Gemmatimonadaceae bacterium]|nr:hypothetical protein [Gemmatimonadaceae bacterium]